MEGILVGALSLFLANGNIGKIPESCLLCTYEVLRRRHDIHVVIPDRPPPQDVVNGSRKRVTGAVTSPAVRITHVGCTSFDTQHTLYKYTNLFQYVEGGPLEDILGYSALVLTLHVGMLVSLSCTAGGSYGEHF